jgi:hypothetical protein
MVDPNELQGLLKGLMAEHDALVQQREIVRQQEEALQKQGSELDRKIAGLKQSLQGLSLYSTAKNEPPALTETKPSIADVMKTFSIGNLDKPTTTRRTLTECCRDILSRSGEWMSALQVRQSLHAAGFDFSEYKSNPLSSIHITLKRIVESGQAWSHATSENETLYKWKKEGETVPPLAESPTASHPFATATERVAAKAAERIAAARRTEAQRVAAVKRQQGDR